MEDYSRPAPLVPTVLWEQAALTGWEELQREAIKRGAMRKPEDTQIGGDHYKKKTIQPEAYSYANKLGWHEGEVVKYVTRWQEKGGKQDLEKAIHVLQLLLEKVK